MNIEPIASLDEIRALLADCHLPISDISAASSPLFFGIRSGGALLAVVGLQLFQSHALLRSLAVSPAQRGNGLARKLVAFAESFAATQGVESLFLLTSCADAFFAKLGYQPASRQSAPQAIQATPQFSGLCPASASFMTKNVAPG